MKITILAEDQAKFDSRYLAEHGLSILIEDDKKVLFDVGQSDVFLRNAEKLQVDLSDIDYIVLSHGHFDHTDGLKFLGDERKFNVIAHPLCFNKKYYEDTYIGAPFSLEEMEKRFDLITSRQPFKISDNMFFLGEIPRKNDFEGKTPVGYVTEGPKQKEDHVPDDSAIAIKTPKGLVIVTGCSHSGVCNIVEYAKKVTDEDKLYALIGGFHLLGNDKQLEGTIAFLKKQAAKYIYPCHCIDIPALSRFYQTLNATKVCSGERVDL